MAPKARPLIPEVTGQRKPGKKGIAGKIRRIKLRNPEMGAHSIAKLVGCNPSNVTRVLQSFRGSLTDNDLHDFQNNQADFYDRLQLRFLESINDAEILKTPVGTRVISAGILHDKAALKRGQPTENIAILIAAVDTIRDMRKAPANTEESSDEV